MKGKRRVILLGGMVLTSLTLLTACQTSATNNNSLQLILVKLLLKQLSIKYLIATLAMLKSS